MLLTNDSATYAERGAAQPEGYKAQNGRQAGDVAKLAQTLITLASHQPPLRRFIADAIVVAKQKVKNLQEQIEACGDLSTSLALNEAEAAGNERQMYATGAGDRAKEMYACP
jgi:hypothetical protein